MTKCQLKQWWNFWYLHPRQLGLLGRVSTMKKPFTLATKKTFTWATARLCWHEWYWHYWPLCSLIGTCQIWDRSKMRVMFLFLEKDKVQWCPMLCPYIPYHPWLPGIFIYMDGELIWVFTKVNIQIVPWILWGIAKKGRKNHWVKNPMVQSGAS